MFTRFVFVRFLSGSDVETMKDRFSKNNQNSSRNIEIVVLVYSDNSLDQESAFRKSRQRAKQHGQAECFFL